MKILCIFAAAMLLLAVVCHPAQSATISSPVIYIGTADGGSLVNSFPAYNFENNHLFGWDGLSGGQMIVSLNDGESVLNATISATYALDLVQLEDAGYSKSWALSFSSAYPTAGSQLGDQLWKQIGPYGEFPIWWGWQDDNVERFIKVKFEVQTTLGLFTDDNGGLGYRGIYGVVPEPSSIGLFTVGMVVIFGSIRKRLR